MSESRVLIRASVIFTVAFAPLVLADAGSQRTLAECATEGDDDLRLACYDAEVARILDVRPAAAAPKEDDSAEVTPAKSTRQDGKQSGGDADAADQFGMTGELARKMAEQGNGSEQIDSVAAVIARIDEKPRGERIVYLENGQVWEEISRNRNLPLAVGDGITLKSAAFGSYKLIGPGGKRFTRASRIK